MIPKKTITLTAEELIKIIMSVNDAHLDMIEEVYRESHDGKRNELFPIFKLYNKVNNKLLVDILEEDNGDQFIDTIIKGMAEADAISKAGLN
jgi:hypothetical protein